MHNIEKFIRTACPEEFEIVDKYEDADITVEHIIGDHWASPCVQDKQLSHRIKNKPFVLFWHCFGCPPEQAPGNKFYQWTMDNATFIYTPWPLELYGFGDRENTYIGPWGYDSDLFYLDESGLPRTRNVMATGYVSAFEALEEIHEACIRTNREMIHVGHNFNWSSHYKHFENVTDDCMRNLYNHCEFVNGMRRGEGFEIPILEGLACGCIPIIFENIHYTRWFKKLGVFIKEEGFEQVRNELIRLFKMDDFIKMATENRKGVADRVKEKYAWKVVAPVFWKQLKKRIM